MNGGLEVLVRDNSLLPGKTGETADEKFDVSEVLDALSELQQEGGDLEGRIEDDANELFDDDSLEVVSPIIEQDLDADSYNNAVYDSSIRAGDEVYSQAYEPYESSDSGASYEVAEHEFLEEAQRIQEEARENNLYNRANVSAQLDSESKAVKEDMKMRSLALWWVMYDGKIKFS
ncbi:hypothetical protein D6825_01710 [Candidatus Woesearchaeota archaeon]|nr:MAG: hypothetical protein D6825_01710 [Candidatus Woesearchaeota archaeon]